MSTPEYVMPEPIYAQQIVPLGYGVGGSRFGMGDMEKMMQETREKIMQEMTSIRDRPRTYDEYKKQQRYQFYQR